MTSKYINLNPDDRFVKTDLLRSSYVHYRESLAPLAMRYVPLGDGFELGIVSSQVPEIARGISSILSRSLEDAKDTNHGYLPPGVVERVQREIISPFGISQLWGTTGHRFVMSRSMDYGKHEIVASILIGQSKDTIFFFTGRYNNLKHSTIAQDVDLNQSADGNPNHKWFDQFAFPDLENFKPKMYHQIANFVVSKEHRGKKLSRFFLQNIVKYYSKWHMMATNQAVIHSQHLLCGNGLWQIGDPPWLPKMQALGFYLRGGAESFFIEQDWAPLTPVLDEQGKSISNVKYNQSFDLPAKYENWISTYSHQHMIERIPEVIRLSQDPRAKLQYFQAMFNFL